MREDHAAAYEHHMNYRPKKGVRHPECMNPTGIPSSSLGGQRVVLRLDATAPRLSGSGRCRVGRTEEALYEGAFSGRIFEGPAPQRQKNPDQPLHVERVIALQ